MRIALVLRANVIRLYFHWSGSSVCIPRVGLLVVWFALVSGLGCSVSCVVLVVVVPHHRCSVVVG